MELPLLRHYLAQAERHVAEGQERLDRQRELIAALERDNHDTALARELLLQFENTQAMHVYERDRFKRELQRREGRSPPPPGGNLDGQSLKHPNGRS